MRCPKCGYISFEYNQLCPKCHKDVTAEAAKMNVPTFKPNPPAMLGALTGEASETSVNLLKDTSASISGIEEGLDLSYDDPGPVSSEDVELDDGQGLDVDIQAIGGDTGAEDSGQEEEEKDDLLLDLDDLKMGDSDQAEDSESSDGEELDLGDIALDDSSGLEAEVKSLVSEDEDEPLEIDDISLDGLTLADDD